MKNFELIKKYNIRPQKKLGQNFLIDGNIQHKLIDALQLAESDTVLEIGPGYGALTRFLVERGIAIVAVEKDRKLCAVLDEELIPISRSFKLFNESILDFSFTEHIGEKTVKVIGNLPYYMSTNILLYLIRQRSHIVFSIVTVQKELADRLLATPGNRDYGRITVVLRYFADVKRLFDIQPSSFFPKPDVVSTVIKVTFHSQRIEHLDEDLFLHVVEALFQERRKKIINSLCLLKTKTITKKMSAAIFEKANISPDKRAEELMIKDFIALTRVISTI